MNFAFADPEAARVAVRCLASSRPETHQTAIAHSWPRDTDLTICFAQGAYDMKPIFDRETGAILTL